MKRLVVLLPMVWAGYAAPLGADDGASARAVFARICILEGTKLGYRADALKKYVESCVHAKLKVFDDDMADPATANLPISC